ncbi:cytochrome b5, seed isoform isoform X2 [Benincasa hispida]|uniref:cytochrome b5, seed isoform isoform X2 n=1 Tax=Benincasa hispida TaxID=102211 RepID=UPI0019020BE1|nr:cytochrome b5, seed isoform isoform X2 [Benincasa hispida]
MMFTFNFCGRLVGKQNYMFFSYLKILFSSFSHIRFASRLLGCILFVVYDVTKFLEDHPGGDEVLLSGVGKDATNDFFDVGHSSAARAMMEEFYVGDIDSSTIPAKRTYTPPKQPLYNQDKTPEFIIKVLQFLAPLIILGLAFGIHLYTKTT